MEEKPTPHYHKERPPCPFYGFNGMHNVFFDTEGNQCGLITISHSPCKMEQEGGTPNWKECHLNSRENRVALGTRLDLYVHPKEFQPPSGKGFRSFTIRKWFEYLGVPIGLELD